MNVQIILSECFPVISTQYNKHSHVKITVSTIDMSYTINNWIAIRQ